MTFEEWRPIAALMENLWKDEFDKLREAAYYRVLAHVPALLVERAVTAIAGSRALTKPPVSAAGAYLPSAETIARECAAHDRVGSWPWAHQQLWAWLGDVTDAYRSEYGMFMPPDEYFETCRQGLLNRMRDEYSWEDYGPRMAAFVDSFGLGYLLRQGGGNWFHAEARRRWDHLSVGPGGDVLTLAP